MVNVEAIQCIVDGWILVRSGKRKRIDKKKLTNDSRRVASRASSVVETRWARLDPCYSTARDVSSMC